MDYVVAQVNIGRLVAPLDSPQLADFAAWLDPVNAVADGAPGFVWRLQTEDGNATALRAFEQDAEGSDGGILINMSVWETVEALAAFVYGDAHRAVLRRRREWFERLKDAYAGAVVGTARAHPDRRRGRGPGEAPARPRARRPTPSRSRSTSRRPDSADAEPLHSPEDWACPV